MRQGKGYHSMAKEVVTKLIDDLDGKAAAETVRFALDGTEYEIDLSGPNAKKLTTAFAPQLEAGQRAPKLAPTRRAVTPTRGRSREELAAVRAWAVANGHKVADR